MSTRSSIIFDGAFHLFNETQEFRLCLEHFGKENPWNGGIFISKKDLISFAESVLKWSKTAEGKAWEDPKTEYVEYE